MSYLSELLAKYRNAPAPDIGSTESSGGGAQLSAIEDVALSRQLKYWNRPAAYKIKVDAGRFNMSWNNPIGRMWVFPAGTVQHSDGTTPIRTSTASQPDVTIPAGGGYVWLVGATWNGFHILDSYDTSATLTGALADLPPLSYYLGLSNCSKVTGDLSNLPPLTHFLDLYKCSLVTGNLSDLPPLTNTLNLSNCTKITGDLADLPPLTDTLDLTGCSLVTGNLSDLPPLTNTLNLSRCSNITGALSDLPPLTARLELNYCTKITGDLADLPPLTDTLDLLNCYLVTGSYSSVSGTNVPTNTILHNSGLSATDMDNTLIAYAACTKTGGQLGAYGKTRTTASDAAVLHLTTPVESGGLGWTITGLTVV